MNEWIGVNDRLPNLYQFVLVCEVTDGTDEADPISIARWDGDEWNPIGVGNGQDSDCNAFWSDLFWGIDLQKITHWMELPKPPEVNDE
jgi:hypothetical protein